MNGYIDELRQRWRHFRSSPLTVTEHRVTQDLFANSKGMALTLIVCFGIGVHTIWGYVPTLYILLFIVLFILEVILKIIGSERFAATTTAGQMSPIWRWILFAGSLWSGVVYGLAALVMFLPVTDGDRLLLIGVFFGMVQVASMSGAFFQVIGAWVLLPAVSPTIIALLMIGSTTSMLLTLMLAVSTGGAVYLGRLSSERFRYINELNEENGRLLADISREQEVSEQQRQKAELAVVKNSRFMAAASHDLRQPLHAMGLFQHALRQQVKTKEGDYLCDSMDRSMSVLNRMFDSLLDISQLDAKAVLPDIREVTSGSILTPLVDETRSATNEKNILFESVIADVTLNTDPVLLGRIVRNLLNNAVKFTDSGHVRFLARPVESTLYIEIADSGVGIPESEQTNIFDEFYQLTPATARQHGVGLGLSIVSRLCHLLDISLTVKDNVPMGTVFSLFIPMVSEASVPSSAPDNSEDEPRGLTIVFIEDESDIRNAMRQTLSLWQCEIVCFADPVEAVKAIRDNDIAPNLLICDYQLNSSLNGLDVIHEIRNQTGSDIPSILITGEKSSELEQLGRRANVPVLCKPLSPHELKQTIALYSSTSINQNSSSANSDIN